jgi:hypothetical protein
MRYPMTQIFSGRRIQQLRSAVSALALWHFVPSTPMMYRFQSDDFLLRKILVHN